MANFLPKVFNLLDCFILMVLYNLEQWLNPAYREEKKIQQLKKEFCGNIPFSHLVLKDFFQQEKMVAVLKALTKERLFEKESDLFHFMQTADLSKTNNKELQKFYQFLASPDFIMYLQQLTGMKLSQKNVADFFGSVYQDTDYLLCHDDKLEGRKIAFNVYLSNFAAGEGGSLSLFSCKRGKPWKIEKKITPRFNTLVFFAVSKTSFHEVEEVVVQKQRVTLSGWWH